MHRRIQFPRRRLHRRESHSFLCCRSCYSTSDGDSSSSSPGLDSSDIRLDEPQDDRLLRRSVRRLLVGLGNPGKMFERTRHNVGKEALEYLLVHPPSGVDLDWTAGKDMKDARLYSSEWTFNTSASTTSHDLVDQVSPRRRNKTLEDGVPCPIVDTTILLPKTYMNVSGTPVRTFVQHQRWRLSARGKKPRHEILIVTDDLDLPFGVVHFKKNGGDGGQKGVRDILKCCGTDKIPRLRIGIGPTQSTSARVGNPAKYVLERFNVWEQDRLERLHQHVGKLIQVYLHRGIDTAAQVANGKQLF